VQTVRDYFAGGRVVRVARQGYEEPVTIPRAVPGAVEAGVTVAVETGKLWLTSGGASLCGEPIPPGLLAVQLPPAPLPPTDLLPAQPPAAWAGGYTAAAVLADALAVKARRPLPWLTVRGRWPGRSDGAGRRQTYSPYTASWRSSSRARSARPSASSWPSCPTRRIPGSV
jgi:hypothetical protein